MSWAAERLLADPPRPRSPRFMTSTRSHTLATTARSWVMNSSPVPRCAPGRRQGPAPGAGPSRQAPWSAHRRAAVAGRWPGPSPPSRAGAARRRAGAGRRAASAGSGILTDASSSRRAWPRPNGGGTVRCCASPRPPGHPPASTGSARSAAPGTPWRSRPRANA